jgi:hypothetical protein
MSKMMQLMRTNPCKAAARAARRTTAWQVESRKAGHAFRRRSCLGISACLLALSMPAQAATPVQLQGKSVIVAWSENRSQRNAGAARFRDVAAWHEFRMYVGTSGRVFSRLTNSTRAGTGSADDVSGSASASRSFTFSGRTMTLFIGGRAPSSGVRRLIVEFDGSYASCTAQMSRAKPQGTSRMVSRSIITGKSIETISVAVGAASCAVRNENVFANGN